MARSLRIEYENAYYHVIQRGLERRQIFSTDRDKERFLQYLRDSQDKYGTIVHAYCLMDNHYHMIIQTPLSNLSNIMHYINTSYVVYYNRKNKRVGPLYQGRYKSILIEQDEYLFHLSRYIHLNPIRAKKVKEVGEYRWSSYHDYVSDISDGSWIETNMILGNFGKTINKSRQEYKKFVIAGVGKDKEIRKYIEENTYKGFVMGSVEFCKEIYEKYIEGKEDEEIPKIREFKKDRDLDRNAIEEKVRLLTKDEKAIRKYTIYMMRKYTQRSLKEIAGCFLGIGDTGVSILCARVDRERNKDDKIDKMLIRMEKMCNVET